MKRSILGFLSLLASHTARAQDVVAKGTGSSTRGWSCCKNTCSWANKAPVSSPVITCDNIDNLLDNYARRDGCDSGGGSYECSDLSPWATSNDLAYGYAGVNLAGLNETSWCCSCYQLTFTSGPVVGKKMVVQVVNSGTDLDHDQFDIAIPGGGQGVSKGCSKQYGGADVWGATYGGVAHRDECAALPAPLQGGCFWRFDWFRNADNPTVNWEKVTCPEQLSYVSNCRRGDDPVPGEVIPSPTTTTSAPIASGTVAQGGQCGGKRYTGPTVCVGGTVCTFVDDEHYYCLPDPASTRTTPTSTTASPTATEGVVWDRCGGRGWTGPTKCKDSVCVIIDEWYSQCQPISSTVTSKPPTQTPTTTPKTSSNPWTWTYTRPHRTWPGQPVPSSSSRVVVPSQPGRTTTRPTSIAPPTPVPTVGHLWEQCGGQNWQGPKICVQGLKCVVVDEFYSQCQKI